MCGFSFLILLIFRVKKVSSERRESVVVHDIHDRLADSQELSTKKLSFEDNSKGSVETEKPG